MNIHKVLKFLIWKKGSPLWNEQMKKERFAENLNYIFHFKYIYQ